MARRDQNAEVLLDAILARLRSAFDLNERTCYETLEPFPDDIDCRPGGPIIVTVAMGNGDFPAEYQVGGGIQQVTEELTWAISLYCPIRLDPKGRDPKGLRRVLGYKKQLLAALASFDFTDSGGENFQRDLPLIVGANLPEWNPKGFARITVFVRTCFDWDLEESSSSTGTSSSSSTSSLSSTSSTSSNSSSSSLSASSSSQSDSSTASSGSSSSSSESSSQSSESSSPSSSLSSDSTSSSQSESSSSSETSSGSSISSSST